jgi:Fe-S-cluster containining protein
MDGTASDVLNIPEGINFECTTCGACCQEWPIVIHDEDFERISKLLPDKTTDEIFESLPVDEMPRSYSYITKTRADGRCIFLSADNLCDLHAQFGAAAKPLMCRMFPYNFVPTPSGAYTLISFASTGVQTNSGKPLKEQRTLIESRWHSYKELLGGLELDWRHTELAPGQRLTWTEYLELEKRLLEIFSPLQRPVKSLQLLCEEACDYVRQYHRFSRSPDLDFGIPPEIVDCILVQALLQCYFPPEDLQDTGDLNATWILEQLQTYSSNSGDFSNGALFNTMSEKCQSTSLGSLSDDTEDLLRRFIYCRLFAKVYFGAGHSNFSVLSGFYNLLAILLILRIQLKLLAPTDVFAFTSKFLSSVERNQSGSNFSKESAAILECLFQDQARIGRFLLLAS